MFNPLPPVLGLLPAMGDPGPIVDVTPLLLGLVAAVLGAAVVIVVAAVRHAMRSGFARRVEAPRPLPRAAARALEP